MQGRARCLQERVIREERDHGGTWLSKATATERGSHCGPQLSLVMTLKGPAHKEKKMSRHADNRSSSAHLMGMMLENKRRKRMICRYQRPAKCWRATITSDTTTRAPKRIFVRQFTSRSNRPIWGTKQSPRLAGAAHSPPGERPFPHEHLRPGETVGPVNPYSFG